MRTRRCINPDCRQPLLPAEQGELCSPCYFAIITDPGLADPAPQLEAAPDAEPPPGHQWQRTSAPAVSETR